MVIIAWTTVKAQTSLPTFAVSPEPSLLSKTKLDIDKDSDQNLDLQSNWIRQFWRVKAFYHTDYKHQSLELALMMLIWHNHFALQPLSM